jgi:Do/DeqQ family serine protease
MVWMSVGALLGGGLMAVALQVLNPAQPPAAASPPVEAVQAAFDPAAGPMAPTPVRSGPQGAGGGLAPALALSQLGAPRTAEQVRLSFAPVVRETAPAVVNVFTRRRTRDPMCVMLYGSGGSRQNGGDGSLGSGVILREDGVIVTNNHVVDGAAELVVVLADRREFPAEVLLADPRTDIAVLKIEATRLPTLALADTRALEVGDMVLAIGNPFGVGQTVTSGIVSALARTDVGVTDFAFFIQTDAAINPGNSGGALVDADGRLIGVNTAIFSRSGTSSGVGFAIPAEMVRRIVDAAVNEGRVIRPWLGFKAQSVTMAMAETLGLGAPSGVLVTEVFPNSTADRAGLRRGDVVLSIDGREVFDEGGVRYLSAVRRPGEVAQLRILRAGQRRNISLTLEPPPGAREADVFAVSGTNPFQGAEVAALSPALAEEIGLDPFQRGVMINRMTRASLAFRFGLRPGDIIESVNGRAVNTLAEFRTALTQAQGAVWRADINRGGRRLQLQARV